MAAGPVTAANGKGHSGKRAQRPDTGRRQPWRVALGLIALTTGFMLGEARAGTLQDDFSELAARLSPAVVNIATTRATGGAVPGGQGDVRSLGSGFIIDRTGVVVTNNHVVRGATDIRVYLTDGTPLAATVVGRDARTDIAVLEVQAGRPLPFVRFGDSDKAEVGNWALAIGNPFGFGGSVTLGIISARDRNIKGRAPQGGNTGPQYFDFFIQTDAAINSGNSGGPLFNTKGDVIGINTAIISPTNANVGLAFAIPSSFARIVVDQIREFKQARLGYLGVSFREVDIGVARQVGLSVPAGILVTVVRPGGPAQRAGLMPGDVILTFGKTEVDSRRSLPRLVARTPVGTVVPLSVWRNNQLIEVKVTIDALPLSSTQRLSIAPPLQQRFADLGLTVSELSMPLRIQHGIHAAQDGLYVLDVDAGSPHADRLAPGDLITDVYGEPVNRLSDLKARVAEAEAADKGALLVKVNRKDETLFEAVRVQP